MTGSVGLVAVQSHLRASKICSWTRWVPMTRIVGVLGPTSRESNRHASLWPLLSSTTVHVSATFLL